MENVYRRKVHSIWHTVRKEYISVFFLFVISIIGQLWKIVNTFFFLSVLKFKEWHSHPQPQQKNSYQLNRWPSTSWGLSRARWANTKGGIREGQLLGLWRRLSWPPRKRPSLWKGPSEHSLFSQTRVKVDCGSGKERTLILPLWVPRFPDTLMEDLYSYEGLWTVTCPSDF